MSVERANAGLQSRATTDTKWLDQISEDDFGGAASTLYEMSRHETEFSRKKTILSLCKLSALISGNLTTFRDIDHQLDEIEFEQKQSMAAEGNQLTNQ